MEQQNYQIGQILFILSQKYNKVIPVKVTEHIISKTANGERSKYIVSPYFNKNKSYNLEQLSGKVLFSTKEVYEHMLGNAAKAIETIINESVENAKLLGYTQSLDLLDNETQIEEEKHVQSAPESVETAVNDNNEAQQENVDSANIPDTITLPDGTVAKVNIK